MTFKHFLPLLAFSLVACTNQPTAPGTTSSVGTTTPAAAADIAKTPSLLNVLVDEVRTLDKKPGKALQQAAQQAALTHDPLSAKKAAILALYLRQNPLAVKMSDLWLSKQPNNILALQIKTFAHLGLGQQSQVRADINTLIHAYPQQGLNQLLRNSQQLPATQQRLLLATLGSLTQKYPQDARLWFAKAITRQHNQQYQDALTACNRALAIRPDHMQSLLLKTQLLSLLNRPEDAREWLRDVRDDHPQNAELADRYLRLLVTQHRDDDIADATQYFLNHFPQQLDRTLSLAAFVLENNHASTAITLLKALQTQQYKINDVTFLFARAEALQGRTNAAINAYLVVNGKRASTAKVAAANLLYQTGQPDTAHRIYSELRQQHPNMAAHLWTFEIGHLVQHKKYDSAWALLQTAVSAFPENTDLLYMHAMSQNRRGQHQAAIKDLYALIKLAPNNTYALNALGYTLSNQTSRYNEAWYYIKRAYARAPDNPAIQDSLGWVLYRLGQFDRALPLLKKAYKGEPGPEVAAHLIHTLRALGKTQQADKQLSDALQRYPNNRFLTALTTQKTAS